MKPLTGEIEDWAYTELLRGVASCGRADLAIETLVLDPKWRHLFTADEQAKARERLSVIQSRAKAYDLEAAEYLAVNDFPRRIGRPGSIGWYGRFGHEKNECKATEMIAGQMRAGQRAECYVPSHIASCGACRTRYPDVVQALAEIERRGERTARALIDRLDKSLDLTGDFIVPLLNVDPSDFEDDEDATAKEQFALQKESRLAEARELLAWRSMKLAGLTIGYLRCFFSYLGEEDDLGLDQLETWRKPEQGGAAARFIQSLSKDKYLGLIFAVTLAGAVVPVGHLIFSLEGEGMDPVPGLLQVEVADSVDEWESAETLPSHVNTLFLWRIVYDAMAARFPGLIEDSRCTPLRKAEHPGGMDQFVCEQEMQELMGETWRSLCHEARKALTASQQHYNNKDLADPSSVILSITKAFETQLKCIVRPLYPGNLKHALGKLETWIKTDASALRLQEKGLDRIALLEAIAEVRPVRNDSAHAAKMSSEQVDDVRRSLFEWRGEKGGVFSATLPKLRVMEQYQFERPIFERFAGPLNR